MSLFVTKSIDALKAEAGAQNEGLRRVLGRTDLVLLGVGAVIGAGIFVLTGQAAAANAGPAIVLSMLLAGVVSALAGLCYAEFASTVPVSGSAYTYTYATLGELVAWMIGWDLVLEYALGAATVAVSWSGHFIGFMHQLGIYPPPALSAAPGTLVAVAGGDPVTAVFNLPAVIVTGLVTALLVVGIKESAAFNAVMVAIKVGVVGVVIAVGVFFIAPTNLHPFIPENTGTFGEYGWSGIMRGAAVIFFSFIGFDAVSTAAQEARAPQRDMPMGILGSLAICTTLYMLVSFVMVGMVPYKAMLGSPAPMIVALDSVLGRAESGWTPLLGVVKMLVEIGALAGLTSVMLVMMLAQPRIFHSMAKDGLLPAFAARIHPRWGTPATHDRRHGDCRRAGGGLHAGGGAGPAGQHRDAVCVRRRRYWRAVSPRAPARPRTAVPHAVGAVSADPVGGGEHAADGEPAVGDLGAPADLDGSGAGDLRRLRVPTQQVENLTLGYDGR